jgi:hypothetical protein
LWLSLIVAMLSAMMVNVAISAQPPAVPELSITPTWLPGPGELGDVGDVYDMTVSIADVTDLWAIQFTVKYPEFLGVLSPQNYVEGPFVSGNGAWPTAFYVSNDALNGELTFIIMRLPYGETREGVSGSGILATFEFLVVEAGEGGYGVMDAILLDPTPEPMPYTTAKGGYYYGNTASLVRVNLPEGRKITVGDTFPISAKVRNDGDTPLYVKVRMSLKRMSDGRPIELYTGQTYYGGYIGAAPPATYLYCDGYYPVYEYGWNNPGASLIGEPDENFAYSTVAGSDTSMYTFEDITLPWEGYSVISNVDFQGYTRQDDLGNDFDPYAFTVDGGNAYSWCWCDSMGGSTEWAWTGQRYYLGVYDFPEYYGFPRTEEAVNNAELLINNYGADDVLMEIDAVRMKIEFATIIPVDAPVYVIQPGEELELEDVTWVSTSDHIGAYQLTATLEYSSEQFHWNSMASKAKTLSFWIVP